MIILLAKDNFIGDFARRLANQFKNKEGHEVPVRYFSDNSSSATSPRRITFIGHAHKSKFGEEVGTAYSPEEFVEQFLALPYKDTVKTIDLLGCEIGFFYKGESYASKVAALLFEKGYAVQVNAFSNLIVDKTMDMKSMRVGLYSEGTQMCQVSLCGRKTNMPQELKQRSKLLNERKSEIIFRLHELESLSGHTRAKEKEIKDLQKEKDRVESAIHDLEVDFYKTTKIQESLDTTQDFQFHGKKYSIYYRLKNLVEELPLVDVTEAKLKELAQENHAQYGEKVDQILALKFELVKLQALEDVDFRISALNRNKSWVFGVELEKEKLKKLGLLKEAITSCADASSLKGVVDNALNDAQLVKGTFRHATKDMLEGIKSESNLRYFKHVFSNR